MPLLSLVKNKPAPEPIVGPHTQALRDNLKAITATRTQVMAIVERDRKEAANQELCAATVQQIESVQKEIATLQADARYADLPQPDTRPQEKQLAALQQTLTRQQDVARTATLLRAKYAADMQKLNEILSSHAAKTDRLTWLAGYEDALAKLAPEFLEKEAAYLDVRRRVFAAAALCDALSRERHFGQFVGAGSGADFHIPRPMHPSFDDGLTPEQSYAAREQYSLSIAAGASALVRELRGTE